LCGATSPAVGGVRGSWSTAGELLGALNPMVRCAPSSPIACPLPPQKSTFFSRSLRSSSRRRRTSWCSIPCYAAPPPAPSLARSRCRRAPSSRSLRLRPLQLENCAAPVFPPPPTAPPLARFCLLQQQRQIVIFALASLGLGTHRSRLCAWRRCQTGPCRSATTRWSSRPRCRRSART
jgi:hypothetical protein